MLDELRAIETKSKWDPHKDLMDAACQLDVKKLTGHKLWEVRRHGGKNVPAYRLFFTIDNTDKSFIVIDIQLKANIKQSWTPPELE